MPSVALRDTKKKRIAIGLRFLPELSVNRLGFPSTLKVSRFWITPPVLRFSISKVESTYLKNIA